MTPEALLGLLQIPQDHERMAAALAEQNRLAKQRMRREMGLD